MSLEDMDNTYKYNRFHSHHRWSTFFFRGANNCCIYFIQIRIVVYRLSCIQAARAHTALNCGFCSMNKLGVYLSTCRRFLHLQLYYTETMWNKAADNINEYNLVVRGSQMNCISRCDIVKHC